MGDVVLPADNAENKMRLDLELLKAILGEPMTCLPMSKAQFKRYQPKQFKVVPEEWRKFVALVRTMGSVHPFGHARHKETLALETVVKAAVRDALEMPVGTDVRFFADDVALCITIEDRLEDQKNRDEDPKYPVHI
jgi:hypothetical protein